MSSVRILLHEFGMSQTEIIIFFKYPDNNVHLQKKKFFKVSVFVFLQNTRWHVVLFVLMWKKINKFSSRDMHTVATTTLFGPS